MTPPKSEFERELRAELERADFGHLSCEQAFEDGARWALDRTQTKADLLERENEEIKRRVQYVINQIGTGNFTDRNTKEVLEDILNARCEKTSD